jgi:hypothetical protein
MRRAFEDLALIEQLLLIVRVVEEPVAVGGLGGLRELLSLALLLQLLLQSCA